MINERQRVALGLPPRTVSGWLFWLRYWAWSELRLFVVCLLVLIVAAVIVAFDLIRGIRR